MKTRPYIFFYDSNCGVCDSTVDFFLRNSPTQNLHFAPLQSDFATHLLAQNGIADPDLKTAYLFDGTRVHFKSSAILNALSLCKMPFSLFSFLKIIPAKIRDYGYDLFSRNRYRISSLTRQTCRILTNEERGRFKNVQ